MQGKPAAALADCEQALSLAPRNVSVLLRACTCHERLGAHAEALARLAAAAALPDLDAATRAKVAGRQADLQAAVDRARTAADGLWARLSTAADPAAAAAVAAAAEALPAQQPSFKAAWHLAAAAAWCAAEEWTKAKQNASLAEAYGGAADKRQARWLAADILFAQGDLPACAALLEEHAASFDAAAPAADARIAVPAAAEAAARAAAMREAVAAKERGNAAVKRRALAEAVQAYSAALSARGAAAPAFAATLYQNRASALQVRPLLVTA